MPEQTMPDGPEVSTLSYEQARDELAALVARLEGGRVGLEESMRLWQRGEALATHCASWLDAAEATLAEGTAPAGRADAEEPVED